MPLWTVISVDHTESHQEYRTLLESLELASLVTLALLPTCCGYLFMSNSSVYARAKIELVVEELETKYLDKTISLQAFMELKMLMVNDRNILSTMRWPGQLVTKKGIVLPIRLPEPSHNICEHRLYWVCPNLRSPIQ